MHKVISLNYISLYVLRYVSYQRAFDLITDETDMDQQLGKAEPIDFIINNR